MSNAVSGSAVYVATSAPIFETFHIVATVKSARIGTFGSTTTLSGLIGTAVGVGLGVTTGATALDPAIQIFPVLSAAIAVAILATPCVRAKRHFSTPSEPIARTLESLSKTIDEPTTNIFVSTVTGAARLRATIAFTVIGFGAAVAPCVEKISERERSETTIFFTGM